MPKSVKINLEKIEAQRTELEQKNKLESIPDKTIYKIAIERAGQQITKLEKQQEETAEQINDLNQMIDALETVQLDALETVQFYA